MPLILKAPKKPKTTYHNENDESRKMRHEAYNKQAWRKLRLSFLKEHPLCANCLRNGKIVPAVDIHHIRSPFIGGKVNMNLFLDQDNLEALCKECHGEEHGRKDRNPQEIIDALEALFEEVGNEDSGNNQ